MQSSWKLATSRVPVAVIPLVLFLHCRYPLKAGYLSTLKKARVAVCIPFFINTMVCTIFFHMKTAVERFDQRQGKKLKTMYSFPRPFKSTFLSLFKYLKIILMKIVKHQSFQIWLLRFYMHDLTIFLYISCSYLVINCKILTTLHWDVHSAVNTCRLGKTCHRQVYPG